MHHRIAVIALAAAALSVEACADQEGGSRLFTEPRDATPTLSYVTTSSAAIVNPRTHRLEPVPAASMPNGVSASIVGGTVTSSAMLVGSYDPGVASTAGAGSWTFTDSLKHVHKIVLLYRTGGGPPAAMQHYTDGALVSTSAYSWLKISTGYLRTRSYVQSVRNGTLVGTYTISTTIPKTSPNPGPVQPVRLEHAPGASPLQRTLGSVAYALAFGFAPQDATAQGFYFYECRQQWLHYAVAAALLSGSAAAITAAPELTPALLTVFIGALGTAAAMEDLLIDCMIANDSLASGGFGGSGGFGSGGGTGGSGGGNDDCLQGSYAAHCTTPFTL
ncbi:MAG TPA: hypothetical protein VGJ12_14620 [Gemmatimonadaceae bacterium]